MTSKVTFRNLGAFTHPWLLLLLSHSVVSDSLLPHGLHHTRLPHPSLHSRVCSISCPLSWWCHSTVSSSIVLFSTCPQSFPASGSFQWVGSSHQVPKVFGAPDLASVLPMYIQCQFPLGLTGLISLLSKGISRISSSTTVWKHQLFGTQPLQSNSYICAWLLEKP